MSVDVFDSATSLQVRDRLTHLKAIVQYKGKLSQEYTNVYEVTHTHTALQQLLEIAHIE